MVRLVAVANRDAVRTARVVRILAFAIFVELLGIGLLGGSALALVAGIALGLLGAADYFGIASGESVIHRLEANVRRRRELHYRQLVEPASKDIEEARAARDADAERLNSPTP